LNTDNVPSTKPRANIVGFSGWNEAETTAAEDESGFSNMDDFEHCKSWRYIVGGAAEAERSMLESDESAKAVGGDGCACAGSRSLSLLSEYDCTASWRDVVK
jgi:hypothetical protein